MTLFPGRGDLYLERAVRWACITPGQRGDWTVEGLAARCSCLSARLGRRAVSSIASVSPAVEILPVGSPKLLLVPMGDREEEWIAEQGRTAVHRASNALAKTLALEALVSLCVRSADLAEIDVARDEAGAPYVELSGACLRGAREAGIREIAISLSNDGDAVAGLALALRDHATPHGSGAVDGAVPLGAGIDILTVSAVSDILQLPPGPLNRILTTQEIESIERAPRHAAGVLLAGTLAAKEAAFKSLGAPLRAARSRTLIADPLADSRADFREFDIVRSKGGRATARLYGGMAEVVCRMGIAVSHVPVVIGHCGGLVGAVALCLPVRSPQSETRVMTINECGGSKSRALR